MLGNATQDKRRQNLYNLWGCEEKKKRGFWAPAKGEKRIGVGLKLHRQTTFSKLGGRTDDHL